MDILAPVREWLIGKALKKALVTVVQAAVSFALAHSGAAEKAGVAISIDPNAMTAFLIAGSEVVRNFLKSKFPKAFGWL